MMFLLAGLAVAVPVFAVPTSVTNFNLALPGTTAAAEPDLAGTVISDKIVPFAVSGGSAPVSGTLQVRVVRNAAGKLVFYWKVNNSAASKGGIDAATFKNFPKKVFDANWRKDGLGSVAPTTVGGTLSMFDFKTWICGFLFESPVKAGESSRFFFLRTDATQSVPAVGYVGASGGVVEVPLLGPAS